MPQPLSTNMLSGTRTSMAHGAERTFTGLIIDVTSSSPSVPYDNGRGIVSLATSLLYSIEVVIDGKPVRFPPAQPNQPRPDYKVYSARKHDPCRCFWIGKMLAFQVAEAPYAEECQ